MRFKKTIILLLALTCIGCCTNRITFSKQHNPYIPKTTDFKQKKLALVLGGGGAKGFAHLGVLEELSRAGIQPDVIIGCSSGSIVGALYADNQDIQALKDLLLSCKKSDVIELSSFEWPYGVYNKNKLQAYLDKNLRAKNFADLKIPFVATAVNLQYGNLTAFSEGDLIPAILASAAFPGAYAPVQIGDQYFVDCAVADPVPVRLAKELGFETVIAVNIAEQLPTSAPNHGLGVLKRSLEIAYINQSKFAVEQADVVIDFAFKDIGLFTDEYNHYLYEEGKKATKLAMDGIQKTINNQNRKT